LSPQHRGLSLVWDVIFVDTFAHSHYHDVVSATQAGIAALDAKATKCWKYNDLHDNYCCQL